MIREKPLFKKGGVVFIPRKIEVDKFLIDGFAPKEYGNESGNIKCIISAFYFKFKSSTTVVQLANELI